MKILLIFLLTFALRSDIDYRTEYRHPIIIDQRSETIAWQNWNWMFLFFSFLSKWFSIESCLNVMMKYWNGSNLKHFEWLKTFQQRMHSFVQKWNCLFLLNLTNNPNRNSNKTWVFSLFSKDIFISNFIAAITLMFVCVCAIEISLFGWFVYHCHTIFELWMFRN